MYGGQTFALTSVTQASLSQIHPLPLSLLFVWYEILPVCHVCHSKVGGRGAVDVHEFHPGSRRGASALHGMRPLRARGLGSNQACWSSSDTKQQKTQTAGTPPAPCRPPKPETALPGPTLLSRSLQPTVPSVRSGVEPRLGTGREFCSPDPTEWLRTRR